MKIHFSKKFEKNYYKRVPKNSLLEKRYIERVNIFISNTNSPILRDHGLSGRLRDHRSFSIKGDFRVVYLPIAKNEAIFVDIGTHNQVYR